MHEGNVKQIEEQRRSTKDAKRAMPRLLGVLKEGQAQEHGPKRHQEELQRWRILRAVQERCDGQQAGALRRPGSRITISMNESKEQESQQTHAAQCDETTALNGLRHQEGRAHGVARQEHAHPRQQRIPNKKQHSFPDLKRPLLMQKDPKDVEFARRDDIVSETRFIEGRWLSLVLRCVILGSLVNPSCHAFGAEFQVGVARRVITPDPLLPVSGGMGPASPATEKRGELMACALVMQSGTERVAIVSVDLLGFPRVLGDRARQLISGVPAGNVLIGASHTHSAPDCYAFPDGKGGHTGDLKYMDFVSRQVSAAVNEATSKLQPAKVRIGTGEARGKIAYNYYAPDLYDRRVSVIQAARENGEVIATLVNYAVHPEVLGAGVGICSPDLIGPLRSRIEERVGGLAMFMNGALGGMVTADNRNLDEPADPLRARWRDSRTWEECVRIGHVLADESLRIVDPVAFENAPTLRCQGLEVRFPVESDAMWAVVQHSPLNYPHHADRSITTRMNALQLGSAKILTIPGEALPNIGFYLKRKMGGEHNLLFGLTNDAFGYILTKEDFNSFDRYDYISRTSLGERTGEILIEKSLELLGR